MIDVNKCLEYKGYLGSVEYSAPDRLLCGEVLGIKSLIMYHSDTLQGLITDFQDAVDHYLSHCEEEGKEPQKPSYDTAVVLERR